MFRMISYQYISVNRNGCLSLWSTIAVLRLWEMSSIFNASWVWNTFISLPDRAATCLAAHWEALTTALSPSFQQHNISTQSVRHSLPLPTSWAYYYTKACKVLFSNCCLELLTCRWSVPSFCKNKTILVKFVGSKLRGGGVSVKLTSHCYSALHRGSSRGEGNGCAMKCLSTG